MAKEYDEGMREFLAFLKIKIKNGAKQNEISKFIGRVNSYTNRLYLKNPKSCPLEVKEKIAEFFNLSLDEMLQQGAAILEKSTDNDLLLSSENKNEEPLIERRSTSTKSLLRQLELAILKNSEECEKYKILFKDSNTVLSFFKASFNEIHQGITFFDTNNNLAFSTNRWNLLPSLSESKNRSLDAMIISLANKVTNYDELITVAKQYQEKKEKKIIHVSFKDKGTFKFTIVPVFENGKFLGTALINSPCDSPLFSEG